MTAHIDFREISVIVQGAIIPGVTEVTLRSIRNCLPSATIILSTWEDGDIDETLFDLIIRSKDPGAIAEMHIPELAIIKPNNINRQIVSTNAGLNAAKTKYALKIRTDFCIKHCGFLNFFDKYALRCDDLKLFDHRVVSVLGDKPEMKPFFPYDFTFFGLRDDLKLLFNVPLMTKIDAEWFPEHTPIDKTRYDFIKGRFRYIPEQHIWINALSKKFPSIKELMFDCSDVSIRAIKLGELSFVNNLIALEFHQFGVYPLKPSLFWLLNHRFHTFSHNNWLALYKKQFHCQLQISFIGRVFTDEDLLPIHGHLNKVRFAEEVKTRAEAMVGVMADLIVLMIVLARYLLKTGWR